MDFNPLSISGKSSMRRKQSNSLLQAFGKPSSSRQSAIPLPSAQGVSSPPPSTNAPLTATTATFNHDELNSPSPEYDTLSLASRGTHHTQSTSTVAAAGAGHYGIGLGHGAASNHPHGHGHGYGGRSASATYSIKEKGKDAAAVLRRPEDVFRLVRERMLSWSYMMEWYQGDTHWLNTVRIPRPLFESSVGHKNLEARARNFYVLGISVSALFDIPSAGDFLRALNRLLDDWEGWAEGSGGKGVKNLFRGQRNARKVTAGGSMMSDYAAGADGSESYLLNVNLPFVPDFFQVHSSICSIIRDVYKKLLSMFLPPPPTPSPLPSQTQTQPHLQSLHHPSTVIQSAPLDVPFAGGPMSPTGSIATATFANQVTSPTSEPGHGYGHGHAHSYASFGGTAQPGSYPTGGSGDALQAFIAGELPADRTLVGDGQRLTPQVVELFLKVDTKLKKHFSTLLREGDTLARRVLDEELLALLSSLNPGARALNFDVGAATVGSGNGWAGPGATTAYGGTVSGAGFSGLGGLLEDERRERDYGTI